MTEYTFGWRVDGNEVDFDRWLAEHDRQVAAQAFRYAASESEVLGVPSHETGIWLNNLADAYELENARG